MFEVGWSEILILAAVALVVVGPKDLPVLLRTIGRYVGLAKRHVGAFRAHLDEAVREADLDLVRRELEELRITADKETTSEPKPGATGLNRFGINR